MRPRSAMWLMAILCLASVPALAAQHAQVGPQVITIPSNNPGQPITIKVPNSTQLSALQSFFTGAYPKGGTRNVLDPTDVTWVSNTPSVATVNTNGVLTAVAPGTATITATYGRLTGTVQVAVIGLQSLTIVPPPSGTSIPIGDLAQFSATGNYTDCGTNPLDCGVPLTDFVVWTSSPDSVHFPITNGNPGGGVVKVEVGTTSGSTSQISCMAGTFPCSPLSVTVTAVQATVDFVVVSPHSAATNALGQATFTANCLYSDGATTPAVTCSGDANHAGITVNWTSGGTGDTGTALVVGTGNSTTATAVLNGTVTVTANPSITTTCRGTACTGRLDVGLTSVDSPIIGATHIPKGATQQYKVNGHFGATVQDITNYVTWSTASISPASPAINISINRIGLATALAAAGSTSNIFAGIDPCTAPGLMCVLTTATVDPAALVSIAITPVSTSLALGAKRQYTAIGTYTDKSTANITNSVVWNSSDPTKAAFSSSKPGQLIANSTYNQGLTNISASQGSLPVVISNSVALTVTKAVLSSITATPKNPSVPTGDTQQFVATGKYSDGFIAPQPWPWGGDANHAPETALTWSSSSPNAATIDSSTGMADVIGTNGTATIKATSGAVTGSTVLTVAPAALKSIAITPTNASIAQNDTQQFTATGTFTDNSQKDITTDVDWSETDGSGGNNATVSNTPGSVGLATAVNAGTATIKATDPVTNVANSVTMTITPRALQSIAVTPASSTVNAGSTQQFTATGSYNAPPPNQDITNSVTWASDNTAVATIDASGLATANSAGIAHITASQGSVTSPQATLTVNQPTLQSITITPNGNNVVVPVNQTQQFTATGNYSDGSTQDLSAIATWSLQKNLGDNIDATGLYTAGKTPGSQTVSATCASGQCGNGTANASQAFTVTF